MKGQMKLNIAWMMGIVYVYLLFYVGFYWAQPGNGQAMSLLAYWAPVAASLFATISVVMAWLRAPAADRTLWQGVALSVGTWTIAEIMWVFSDTAVMEVLANVLWLVGYLPLSVVFQQRFSVIRSQLTWKKIAIASLGAVLPMFVLVGTMVSLSANLALGVQLGDVVNIVYVVWDSFLAVGGVLLWLTGKRDVQQRPWAMIGFALVLWVYSDSAYWLLNLMDVYGVNGLSMILETIPYILSYVVIGLGGMQTLSVAHPVATAEVMG
ncbi:MAG: hypothetical protein JXA33_15670 [Anaerolineae bacterium]|nr:hypothetical protein [Anaerolineae bacterium]